MEKWKWIILSLVCGIQWGCQWGAEKAPQDWTQWTEKSVARYQEKFSNPTITHHIYLEAPGDVAYLNLQGDYPRFEKQKSQDDQIQVSRGQALDVYVNVKGMSEKSLLDPEKPSPIFNNDRYYLSAYPNKEENNVRVFVHDLGQKNLSDKRQRQYFSYSPDWVMQASWHVLAQPEKKTIHRSDGSVKDMEKVAELHGQMRGREVVLSVFDFAGQGSYKKDSESMLLFRDQSNGKSTYGAGRFLNVAFPQKMGEMKDAEKVLVDFNYSYNPPCAVSTGFHCPLPIDTLSLAIEAGEKSFKKH